MFESLIITLREGVEAALVLGIADAFLRRRGRERLQGALFAGAGVALALSVVAAVVATSIPYNQEVAEGIGMLVGAVLVTTLVVWMWRAAPRMRHEIESGLTRAEAAGAGAAGVFLFAFGMVFREGLETAVFLSAAGFGRQGLGMWLGAGIGLALAAVFGVLFVRGSLRVPLKPFFLITSAVLILLALQLLVGGLHELSEGGVLPASRREMAIVGPIVKNELLLFTLTVALAAGWLLFGSRFAEPVEAQGPGPEARLARAAVLRERSRRRWTGLVGILIVGFLATAFVVQSRVPPKPPAAPLALASGTARFDSAPLADGHAHFYEVALPERSVRFFAIRVDGEVKTCFDACQICGDLGYFEDGSSVVCRNCTSPIVTASLGATGGCNPIPLPHRAVGGQVEVTASDLARVLPYVAGR